MHFLVINPPLPFTFDFQGVFHDEGKTGGETMHIFSLLYLTK